MSYITLQNNQLRTTLDPAHGVNVLGFWVSHRNRWLPIMPDVQTESVDLKMSSFVMAPYSNRIENGRFVFKGRDHQLAHGERHAIHGDVRGRPWVVTEQSGTRLVCSFDARNHENVNWPWPFAAQLVYEVVDSTLASQLTLWNRGDSPMPAGFGWHPYFSRSLTQEGEALLLNFVVTGAYPDANDNRIPSGPPQPLTDAQNFAQEKGLAPDTRLDTCFFGYDGQGSITWPESGVRLRFDCSPQCSHLILYNPPKPYFAAEPVTNANNGVNLYAHGDPTSGVAVLAPDEGLEAYFRLHVELDELDRVR